MVAVFRKREVFMIIVLMEGSSRIFKEYRVFIAVRKCERRTLISSCFSDTRRVRAFVNNGFSDHLSPICPRILGSFVINLSSDSRIYRSPFCVESFVTNLSSDFRIICHELTLTHRVNNTLCILYVILSIVYSMLLPKRPRN